MVADDDQPVTSAERRRQRVVDGDHAVTTVDDQLAGLQSLQGGHVRQRTYKYRWPP